MYKTSSKCVQVCSNDENRRKVKFQPPDKKIFLNLDEDLSTKVSNLYVAFLLKKHFILNEMLIYC